MVGEARSKITRQGRAIVVVVPKEVYLDSLFPFKVGEEVVVRIADGKLEVAKR